MATIVLGVVTMIVLLEATRRAVGWPIVLVAVAFLLYTRFSDLFPGLLQARGYDISRMVAVLYTGRDGIFGMPTGIAGSIILVFILFGQLLLVVGAGRWFIDLACAIAGRFRGGPAKVAVIASALFGTISGSPAANVAATGVLTIPLMKSIGYKPSFAAAVESVASTGGAIMPPVMAVTAFIMAEFLGIPYASVAIAAFLPAILYYIAVFVQVHLEAVKTGLHGLPREEVPGFWKTFKQGCHFLLPIGVLVYFLLIRGYSPTTSALYACAALVLASMVRKGTRPNPRRMLQALEGTGQGMLLIGTACAISGIVIGCTVLTGVGIRLAQLLITTAGGSTFVLLLLAAVTSAILGMGISVIVAYILLAILVAPALTGMGMLPLASHLFVYYFAVLSFITPPICVSVYIAAGIANAPMMRTGLQAVRLGIVAYIVPFMFMYDSALLLKGSPAAVALAVVTSVVGVIALAAGVSGYALRRTNWLERILLLAAGVGLIMPGWITDVIGAGVLAAVMLWQWKGMRVARVETASKQQTDI